MNPRRISVVGNSGAGKSTLAARIAARLGVPHVELDAINHQPGWTTLARDEFVAQVTSRCEADGWVVDGNYAAVLPSVWKRAELVVWLDLPRWLVLQQIVLRSLERLLKRTELWNGNRERWTALFHWDPNVSVIAWSWTQHHAYVARYERAMRDPANAHLAFRRLRSRREADEFVDRMGA